MTLLPAILPAPRAARWALPAVPLAFLGVVSVSPTATLLLWRGFAGSGGQVVGQDALGAARTWRAVGTTLGLAVAGTAVALGVPLAWEVFRVTWRGQAAVRALASVPFALPTVVVPVAFLALLRPTGLLGVLHADHSLAAIVAALAFFNVSVVMHVVRGTWAGLAPRDPAVLVPAIAAAASVVFLLCASSFAIVVVLGGTRTNSVETEFWVQVNQFLDLKAAAICAPRPPLAGRGQLP